MKGILLLAENFDTKITEKYAIRYFNEAGFEIINTPDLEAAKHYTTHHPIDFIVLHCHTKYGSFESVRLFCEHLHTTGCIILITCNSNQLEYYDQRHKIRSFKHHHLIDTITPFHEIITKIKASRSQDLKAI